MKILVTGATGFIGSYLVQRLVELGHHVTALVRNNNDSPNLEEVKDRINYRCDLTDLKYSRLKQNTIKGVGKCGN